MAEYYGEGAAADACSPFAKRSNGRVGVNSPCPEPVSPMARDLAKAIQDAFNGNTLVIGEPAPWIAPPFNATMLDLRARFVISVPPGDPDATSGAVLLAASESLFGVPVPVLTPTVAGPTGRLEIGTEPVPVGSFPFRIPRGQACRLDSVGVSVSDYMAARALLWTLAISGKNSAQGAGQIELGNVSSIAEPTRVFLTGTEDQLVRLLVQNQDIHAGAFVDVRVTGWFWPILRAGTTAREQINRSADGQYGTTPGGYGTKAYGA